MCGIAGKYSVSHQPIRRPELVKMHEAMAHRGPDDFGVEVFKHCGLAHRRLAIIDLSPKGHQPMSYGQGRYWITFNGEIYNYQDLRQLLADKGYTFRSTSDTEVILALYQEFGAKAVTHLNGMFALVIYDRQEDVIFAARDRLGEKPLKYFFDGETFIFASEIQAILTQPEVDPALDWEAIRKYIYWGFVPSPKTGYHAIKKLPAAHTLTLKKGKLQLKRYWDFELAPNTDRSEAATITELRELVEDSVKRRMVADVPVGAFLSGGIDSCVVTGLMSQNSARPVRTYTIGFKGWESNEAPLARVSAKRHRTTHQELIVQPNINTIIPKIVAAYDEPFGDTSAIPSYYVSQITRRHVTVALNGDGGDENFCGYSNYHTLLTQQRLAGFKLPAQLLFQLLSPFKASFASQPLYQRLLRVSDLLGRPVLDGYARHARGYLNVLPFEALFKDRPIDPLAELTPYLPAARSDLTAAVTWADLHNVLPDGLMTKMDIASMQHALETRAPLLDHRLIEYTATIPTTLKYKNGESKYIFKKAFADLIPARVRTSPKRGFVMPVGQWLRGPLRSFLHRHLDDPLALVYQLLDYSTVQQLIKYHETIEIDYSPFLWRFLMLELWLRKNKS